MPNGSRSPWTTSSRHLDGVELGEPALGGFPPARRGGTSGNARQSTPAAPVASAVRHATRAPDERPPATSGESPSTSARNCSTTAIHAASSWCAGAGLFAPPRGTAARRARRRTPSASAASVAAARSRDCTPPPAPWPSTSQPRGDSACRSCTRAVPCGVSTSSIDRGVCPSRRVRPMSFAASTS